MEAFAHEPVMTREVLAQLRPRSGGIYADATLGGGGHTRAILDASAPDGRVLAIDRDPLAATHARRTLAAYGARLTVVHGRFSELGALLARAGHACVDGVVADLGVSSPQLDLAERGFSFTRDGPLDMRMDATRGETARELIERLSEAELADVLFRYGEERRSRAVARAVHRALREGELATTQDLQRCVARALGRPPGARTDPATRTFQALRIAVNDELSELQALLQELADWLRDGGVAVIISFHSLEDRLVKHAFRSDARLAVLTKRPLVAGEDETRDNRRARSAKLRAAMRRPREPSQVQA